MLAPSSTSARTGSYVVRSGGEPLPATSMATTPRPATRPANDTRPSVAASTRSPGPAARSTPRWPGPYGPVGGSHPRNTEGLLVSGQLRASLSAPPPVPAPAPPPSVPLSVPLPAASGEDTGAPVGTADPPGGVGAAGNSTYSKNAESSTNGVRWAGERRGPG
ncbi:hypothetical protein ASD29_15465 [Streptomyces sp. Root1295]|nr:hypothetical protein ASD29_15465 [Streptomyces sp. Root1295]